MNYKKYLNILLLVAIATAFTACTSKDDIEYNKPAVYWYNKMLQQLSTYQLDAADDTYTSLESEHRNSPLLPSATLIIANMHMQEEEYMMANYYYDEYLKKVTHKDNVDYVRYLKIKAKFLAFKNQYREQELLYDTIKDSQDFVAKYPNSKYVYLVDTINTRLLMAQASFEDEISGLYKRIDKPKGTQYYHAKAQNIWEETSAIVPVHVPWYRAMFE